MKKLAAALLLLLLSGCATMPPADQCFVKRGNTLTFERCPWRL